MKRPTSQRPLLIWVPAVCALLVLAGGLVELHAVFLTEREESLASITERHRSLETLAARLVMQRLAHEAETQALRFPSIAEDPLLPDHGVYWMDAQGRQRLPRARPNTQDTEPTVTQWFNRWNQGEFTSPDADVLERLQILRTLDVALGAKDRKGIEQSFRALLLHRALHHMTPAFDVASQVWALDRLMTGSNVDPALCSLVLLDGIKQPQGSGLEGLQRKVAAQHPRFHPTDARVLADQITRLSQRCAISTSTFHAALTAQPTTPWPVPADLGTAVLLASGRTFIMRNASQELIGIQVDMGRVLQEVQQQMREMLHPDDALLGFGRERVDDDPSVRLTILSPRAKQSVIQCRVRYLVKTGLLGFSGLVAVLAMAAAWLAHLRGLRFLALKSNFVAAVSHELRTPLASMRLLVETMERRLHGDERVRDYPARLLHEIDGLADMVENLLSFHGLEQGRIVLNRTPQNLKDLIEAAAQDALSRSSVQVEMDLGEVEDVTVHVDARLVQLALGNLLRNAIQYNDRTPVRIAVSTSQETQLHIRVRDNGRGIPAQEHQRVFQDFVRGSSSRSHEHGSGLGLAICRQVMELHHGSIAVQDSSSDGTTFRLSLPNGSKP